MGNKVAIIFIIVLIFSSACALLQSCDQSDFTNADDYVNCGRLKLTSQEFAKLLNDRKNYDLFKEVYEKYHEDYIPKSKLSKPNEVNIVSKGITEKKREVEALDVINLLINNNNVFQYDEYVIFISQDLANAKLMYASDYDNFLRNNPKDLFDIPQEIVLREGFMLQKNGPLIKTRTEDDFYSVECTICILAGLAAYCGFAPGLLELGACIVCYYQVKDYYGC